VTGAREPAMMPGNVMWLRLASSAHYASVAAGAIRRSRNDAFSAWAACFRLSSATSYIRPIASACFFLQCAAIILLHAAKLIVGYVERG
jgi:hypothetical protein